MSAECKCEPHAQGSNRCAACKVDMDRQFAKMSPAQPERPHGNHRSPYVRRDSAQLRMSEIDAAIDELLTAKRKLRERIRDLDAEIDNVDTQRSDAPFQAPEREIDHVGEL